MSISLGLRTYGLGIMALLMRQTNIFWVAVFMGGLEAVRTLNFIRPSHLGNTIEIPEETKKKGLFAQTEYFLLSCWQGAFHDPKLGGAGVFGSHPFSI